MRGYVALIAIAFLAMGSAALAGDPPAVDGELHVTCKNAEYVKVQVNGEDFEAIEFERDGKVVLIKGLPLSASEVVLVPRNDALKEATIELEPSDFKRTRRGREYFMVAKKTIKFEDAPAEAPDEADDEPKPDPVAPPPAKKDDL